MPDDFVVDVYDSNVWKQFFGLQRKPFLSGSSLYASMINMDWFQPYEHFFHLVGQIYLLIFNFPRKYTES